MYRLLSEEDCHRIHQASLEVLATTGVKVDDASIIDLLEGEGAKVDRANSVAFLPAEMVARAIDSAPSTVRICDRAGNTVEIGPGYGTVVWTGNALNIIRGRERRAITSPDLADLTRVADWCRNIHGMVGTSVGDYPPPTRDFVGFPIMADNTLKHLRPCLFTPRGAELIIEMAQVLLGGEPLAARPIVSFGYSIISPLRWGEDALGMFRSTSGHGIPFMINAEPLGGGTAPVTLAGCLVIANAESLSGLVIAQLLEPGRPCVFNLGFAHVLDMSSAVALTGASQNTLIQVGGAELARFHRLPCASWMSTEAIIADSQAAMEKMLTGLAHIANRVNIIWGAGNLESTMSMCPEALVIDDEICGAALRYQRGIRVDDESLALEAISEVGLGGSFLDHPHTLAHFREDLTHMRVGSRVRWATWLEQGGRSMEEEAREKVEEILASDPPRYLDDDQRRELERLVKVGLEEIVAG